MLHIQGWIKAPFILKNFHILSIILFKRGINPLINVHLKSFHMIYFYLRTLPFLFNTLVNVWNNMPLLKLKIVKTISIDSHQILHNLHV